MAYVRKAVPPQLPPFRRLRTYAFDPSLEQRLETAALNQVTLEVPWERSAPVPAERIGGSAPPDGLREGPVGEYLEVVDVDPASGCCYAPVDLNAPALLAQDGLTPSEADPQFHQQMVYAVAMTTIRNFERALGRPALWSGRDVRAGEAGESGEAKEAEEGLGPDSTTYAFVPRLRVYPHALREANAYYSPDKKALLFGYFPVEHGGAGSGATGGMVFTCLSHDIVAHEVTHALLDGMNRRLAEPSNPDVLAFHEAFADIVALFQHFSYPEVLRHQIARTRGDLGTESLLGQLAQQFGQAIGNHGALRDALGERDERTGEWRRATPDPTAIRETLDPHPRGSILVAAVFDAFVAMYRRRAQDLIRIATGGTGVLPDGALHPDLVGRLAEEAAKTAQHLTGMCIRALDYCPPVDLTFGEYLRALVTADFDLVPTDRLGYRVALIEAFRNHGIYPPDVRTLSVGSVRWQHPTAAQEAVFTRVFSNPDQLGQLGKSWAPGADRRDVYERSVADAETVRRWVQERLDDPDPELVQEVCREMGLAPGLPLHVHSVRPARRVGPDGQVLSELVIELAQCREGWFGDPPADGRRKAPDFWFRGGCTLLVESGTGRVRYCIRKNVTSKRRYERQRRYVRGDVDHTLQGLYFRGTGDAAAREPFAFLHRSHEAFDAFVPAASHSEVAR